MGLQDVAGAGGGWAVPGGAGGGDSPPGTMGAAPGTTGAVADEGQQRALLDVARREKAQCPTAPLTAWRGLPEDWQRSGTRDEPLASCAHSVQVGAFVFVYRGVHIIAFKADKSALFSPVEGVGQVEGPRASCKAGPSYKAVTAL